MVHISTDDDYYTTITVFTTTPENQRRLFEVIKEGEERLRGFPGLVSAGLHLSHDGTRLIGYAQWEKKEAFDAMRDLPDRQEHFREVHGLVSDVQLISCRVAYTHDEITPSTP